MVNQGPELCMRVRQAALTRVVSQYAVVCCGGNTELAALELRRQLRDHVVFERCASRHGPCVRWQAAA